MIDVFPVPGAPVITIRLNFKVFEYKYKNRETLETKKPDVYSYLC